MEIAACDIREYQCNNNSGSFWVSLPLFTRAARSLNVSHPMIYLQRSDKKHCHTECGATRKIKVSLARLISFHLQTQYHFQAFCFS